MDNAPGDACPLPAPKPAGGPVCPGCGTPTWTASLRIGSGASLITETGPAWCSSCLQKKVTDARGGPCHCAQFPGFHGH